MPQLQRVLIGVAGVLFLAGLGLAIVQPGNLGGDSVETAENTTTTTSTVTDTTSTTLDPNATTVTTDPGGGSTGSGTGTDPGSGAGTDPGSGTGQTGSGSGLGQGGTPQVDDLSNGLPDTGHESLFVLAACFAAAGLATRRLAPS